MAKDNILKIIRREHATVNEMCEKIRDGDKDLFEELRLELWAHQKIEEAIFYPFLEEEKDAVESLNEHHHVAMILEELNLMPRDCMEWDAKFKAFSEMLEHHIKEEEKEDFKSLKENVEEEKLEELGEEFLRRKELIMDGISPIEEE